MTRSRTAGGLLPLFAAAAVGWFSWRAIFFPERRSAIEAIRGEAARLAARLEESNREERARQGPPGEAPTDDGAALTAELERSRRQLGALRSLVPAAPEAEALLHSLPAVAAEEGLTVHRFAPDEEHDRDGYGARPATMDAEGEFFDFIRFFERVAASSHLVLVEEVELRGPPDGGERLSARIGVAVLSRGPADSREDPDRDRNASGAGPGGAR